MKDEGTLIVFAKEPKAGKVKTRLIPSLGIESATELYQELLTRTLNTAVKTKLSDIQLWISGDIEHQYFKQFKDKNYFNYFSQSGEDLGQRMFNAFDSALKTSPYAVLIGSDCPSLSICDLSAAMTSLRKGKDVVLGPAKDGGYYLIGLKKNIPELFANMSWGEESVLSETCARINRLNLDLELLQERNDIDRESDLESYEKIKREESAY